MATVRKSQGNEEAFLHPLQDDPPLQLKSRCLEVMAWFMEECKQSFAKFWKYLLFTNLPEWRSPFLKVISELKEIQAATVCCQRKMTLKDEF